MKSVHFANKDFVINSYHSKPDYMINSNTDFVFHSKCPVFLNGLKTCFLGHVSVKIPIENFANIIGMLLLNVL